MDTTNDGRLAIAQAATGYDFKTTDRLLEALTHKSFSNEAADTPPDYDRLEYLGDAVLDLIVAETLEARYPQLRSGDMTKLRASLVCEKELAELAQRHRLGDAMRLGVGEQRSGGARKPSVLADVYEALIGALYVEGGIEAARRMILTDMDELIGEHFADLTQSDPKSRLQEDCVQRHLGTPDYRILKREGPDHNTVYTVQCVIGGKAVAVGTGRNVKAAEQMAAQAALEITGYSQDEGEGR